MAEHACASRRALFTRRSIWRLASKMASAEARSPIFWIDCPAEPTSRTKSFIALLSFVLEGSGRASATVTRRNKFRRTRKTFLFTGDLAELQEERTAGGRPYGCACPKRIR